MKLSALYEWLQWFHAAEAMINSGLLVSVVILREARTIVTYEEIPSRIRKSSLAIGSRCKRAEDSRIDPSTLVFLPVYGRPLISSFF